MSIATSTDTASGEIADVDHVRFPEGFKWGAATAAYQIEGAASEDGRRPSIWDTFARTPGNVFRGHTGDVACDHYHRYGEDVGLMAKLGLGTYRFSVAWPRIKPDGTGPVNPRGLDFYDRLVDQLLGAGIDPMLTLYHWDLPQDLEDSGGWTQRSTAYAFADLAAATVARLGDRVRSWTTLNEPWCAAFLGYASGEHAPGRREPKASFEAVHHLLLGHGLAAQALRAGGATEVSVTLNPTTVRPVDPSDQHDLAAAKLIDGLQNRLFFDPVLRGVYPDDMLSLFERFGAAYAIHEGDTALMAQPIDFLGVNYYMPAVVRAQVGTPANTAYPGSEGIEFTEQAVPVTAMGWPVDPTGLSDLLVRISVDYPGVPMMITENGAAYVDVVEGDRVADRDRIAYLDGHLRAVHAALTEGADLRGYLAWSLLDNYEWGHGYGQRFGLIHVDYDTQRRVLKDSAHWYAEVIRHNGLT